MKQAHRHSGPGGSYEGLTTIRRGKVDWAGVARFVPDQLAVPLRRKKPTTWFVNSMSDLFHHSLSNEEIAAVFGVMAATPQHTYQVLTKRPKRALEWFGDERGVWDLLGVADEALKSPLAARLYDCVGENDELGNSVQPWPLPNVWLGVSTENQETADERIPLLLKCPATIRWISAEPLLGPIKLHRGHTYCPSHDFKGGFCTEWHPGVVGLDWVVVGGESGNGARPFKLEWAESIVRQCREARVPVFVKQLGAKPIGVAIDMPVPYETRFPTKNRKGNDPSEWPEDLRVREMPEVT